MVKDASIDGGGQGCDFQAGQIGHSVANVTAAMGPATRNTLRRNTANIMKIWLSLVFYNTFTTMQLYEVYHKYLLFLNCVGLIA